MSTIKVSVTAQHIADGTPQQIGLCALALAVKDAFAAAGRPLRSAEVDNDDVNWFVIARPVDGDALWADLESPVQEWVEAFDARRPVEPASFDLDWQAAS